MNKKLLDIFEKDMANLYDAYLIASDNFEEDSIISDMLFKHRCFRNVDRDIDDRIKALNIMTNYFDKIFYF